MLCQVFGNIENKEEGEGGREGEREGERDENGIQLYVTTRPAAKGAHILCERSWNELGKFFTVTGVSQSCAMLPRIQKNGRRIDVDWWIREKQSCRQMIACLLSIRHLVCIWLTERWIIPIFLINIILTHLSQFFLFTCVQMRIDRMESFKDERLLQMFKNFVLPKVPRRF